VAGAVGAGFLGVVLYFVVGSAGPKVAQAPDEVPPIVVRPGEGVFGGENIRIDLADKKRPGRKAGLLVMQQLDPDAGHNHNVTRPEAWLFLTTGEHAYIRADRGRLYMPDDRQPESGRLEGNVVIRVYPPRADGRPADPASDTPLKTFRTQRLDFDSSLAEVWTEDPWSFEQPGLSVKSTGLKVFGNQVLERIERLVTGSGGEMRLSSLPERQRPEPAPPRPSPGSRPAAGEANAAAPPAAATTKPPVETLYHMTFAEGVEFESGPRRASGALLEIWARFIDGKLPEGAIATVRAAEPRPEAKDRPAPAPAGAQPPAAGIAQRPPTGAPESAPARPGRTLEHELVMTWKGPCTVIPVERAEELKADHIAVRFSGSGDERVIFSDSERGLGGRAAAIAYGLTTQRLSLTSPREGQVDPDRAAVLESSGAGSIAAWSIATGLGTGISHIAGPGVIFGRDDQRISWLEQADFESRLGPGGELTSALKQATFSGGVRASSPQGSGGAQFVRADFVEMPGAASALSRLIMQGNAFAKSDESGAISGQMIDVAFAPVEAGSPQPSELSARGGVRVAQQDTAFTADEVDARLARGPTGRPDVTTLAARGNVRYENRQDQIVAVADQVRGDLSWDPPAPGATDPTRRQLIDLTAETGREASITQRDGPLTVEIRGAQIRLDGVARRMSTFGAGSFSLTNPQAQEGPLEINARWMRSMAFDDRAGTIECVGDAHAQSTTDAPEGRAIQKAEAERIVLNVTPYGGQGPAAAAPSGLGRSAGKRGLVRAESIGSVLTRDGGVPATVEFRRLGPITGGEGREPPLVELYFLQGPRIIADQVAQTLDVPSAGRMLIVDQRARAEPETRGGGVLQLGASGGSSLFDWTGSMHMDQGAGSVHFRRGVRLTHRDLQRQVTNLVCEMLIAKVRQRSPDSPGNPATADKVELVSATASGAVYLTSGPERTDGQPRPPTREMIADRLEYDAINRTVDALAAEGNTVMVYEPGRPTPASARRILWHLNTDRIEIKEPGAIVTPAPESLQGQPAR
jgi:hypothetical protein